MTAPTVVSGPLEDAFLHHPTTAALSWAVGAFDDGWRRFQRALADAAGCELPVVLTDACRHNPGGALLRIVVERLGHEREAWSREKSSEVAIRAVLAVLLRFWRGASVREVADELEVSEGTVKNDTALVLRAMRWDWDRLGTTDYAAPVFDELAQGLVEEAGELLQMHVFRPIVPREGLDR